MTDPVLDRMKDEFSLTNAYEYANLWDEICNHVLEGQRDKALDKYVQALHLMEQEVQDLVDEEEGVFQ